VVMSEAISEKKNLTRSSVHFPILSLPPSLKLRE
jgi:hypothetical protein